MPSLLPRLGPGGPQWKEVDRGQEDSEKPQVRWRGCILALEKQWPGCPAVGRIPVAPCHLPHEPCSPHAVRLHSTCQALWCHIRMAEEPVAKGTSGSRHRQTRCLQVIYPPVPPRPPPGTGDDSFWERTVLDWGAGRPPERWSNGSQGHKELGPHIWTPHAEANPTMLTLKCTWINKSEVLRLCLPPPPGTHSQLRLTSVNFQSK